ncbi:hypothetical protein HC024_08120 [Methylococcaceae bacterium WWC4]|nr:hypothetical protein [Methylococcaceae bacterium WWC4]
MITAEEIEFAGQYVESLRQLVHGLELPSSNRSRAAASSLGIALQHHHAIVRLTKEELYASSFALLRIEFEAYIRGEWLSLCASDSIIEAFLKGKEPPKIDCLLSELEMLEGFENKELYNIKNNTWKGLCGYTHTSGLHVQRWNTEDAIEANYSREEILDALKFAEIIASLSVIGIARLAGNEDLAKHVYVTLKQRMRF